MHYLHGEESFSKLSDFLVQIRDPCSGGRYDPLQLEEQWWMENFIGGDYASGPSAVVSNIQAAGALRKQLIFGGIESMQVAVKTHRGQSAGRVEIGQCAIG